MRKTRLDRMLRPVGSWRAAFAGSIVWGGATTLAAGAALGRLTGWIDPHLPALLVVYFLGGFAAFVPSMMTAGLVATGARAEARFAAAFVALAAGTVAATGVVYGLQNMRHDIDWTHFPGPAFPFMDIPRSMIGSLAYYLFLGARLLWPEGLVPLVLAGLWIAHRLR